MRKLREDIFAHLLYTRLVMEWLPIKDLLTSGVLIHKRCKELIMDDSEKARDWWRKYTEGYFGSFMLFMQIKEDMKNPTPADYPTCYLYGLKVEFFFYYG